MVKDEITDLPEFKGEGISGLVLKIEESTGVNEIGCRDPSVTTLRWPPYPSANSLNEYQRLSP